LRLVAYIQLLSRAAYLPNRYIPLGRYPTSINIKNGVGFRDHDE